MVTWISLSNRVGNTGCCVDGGALYLEQTCILLQLIKHTVHLEIRCENPVFCILL